VRFGATSREQVAVDGQQTTGTDGGVGIGEAADRLGISVSQLRRWADAGRVPVTLTSGGHRRFDVEHVRVALGARRMPAPAFEASYPLAGLREDVVWREACSAIGLEPGQESYAIFHYAFTEMVNNAIDHSSGSSATCRVWADPIRFEVVDDGVGAYARLSEALGLPSQMQAVVELSKGKATSDPAHHTGQGIFFTSKALDLFRLEANGISWTVDNLGSPHWPGHLLHFKGARSLPARGERHLVDGGQPQGGPGARCFGCTRWNDGHRLGRTCASALAPRGVRRVHR
jgi:excisionase family DNA binding protein